MKNITSLSTVNILEEILKFMIEDEEESIMDATNVTAGALS